jgi:ABC-type uncharacterized transport system substrate-binding protein
MMKRRDFIAIAGSAVIGLSAHAQEPRRVIGFLSGFEGSTAIPGSAQAFTQGLKETGFVEGRNISIDFRSAEGHYDRLPSLAAELVSRNVSVIYAFDLPSAFAAKAATKTIPIVFTTGADPVKVGLVESLGRPNGNLTGMSVFSAFWDQSVWSFCMSCSRLLMPSHCLGILVMRTSKPTCRTFGPSELAADRRSPPASAGTKSIRP